MALTKFSTACPSETPDNLILFFQTKIPHRNARSVERKGKEVTSDIQATPEKVSEVHRVSLVKELFSKFSDSKQSVEDVESRHEESKSSDSTSVFNVPVISTVLLSFNDPEILACSEGEGSEGVVLRKVEDRPSCQGIAGPQYHNQCWLG